MNLNECYIDLDGVLVDFWGGIVKQYPELKDYYKKKENLGTNDWAKTVGLNQAEFWKPLEHDWWSSLKWTDEGREIVAILKERFGFENCFICTASSQNFGSPSGKMAWLKRHLPQFFYKMQIFICKPKWKLAKEGRIIIDDKFSTCDKFEKNGGVAYRLPRKWNLGFNACSSEDIIEGLKEAINV